MIDLFYSDFHLREDRLDIHEKIHNEIFEIALREGVIESGGYFINGGDTFHVRGLIRTSCFDMLYRKRDEWRRNGLSNHIDIVGNHDQEDKLGNIHPLKIFSEFGSNWHVVDSPKFIEGKSCNIFAFPYMANLDLELKKIPKSKRQSSIAVVHTGIHGAFKNDGDLDDFSIFPEVFKGFKKVFSGHYHNRSLYGGIVQFIGSPVQHNFSEMGQEKGVLIYNRETNKVKFVEIESGPKHFEVNISWEDGNKNISSHKGIGENDIVRVRLNGTSEQVSSVNRNDIGINCRHIKIERKTMDAISSRIKIDNVNNNEIIDMYIDYIQPDLDKARLAKIGSKLMEESHANV